MLEAAGRSHTHGDGELIAHRGASGYRPENTLAAFELAISLGADSLELDVVPTSDGHLIVRHESELSKTTDIASRPEFAQRRTTRTIDHVVHHGWFTDDLTLAEVQTLTAKERMRVVRSANNAFDGQYRVPTLAEVVDLAARSRTGAGQPIGLFIETKHSTHFRALGLPLEAELVRVLAERGYDRAGLPVYLESFETGNLKRLAQLTEHKLVQLVFATGRPADLRAAGDPRTYRDLVTRRGLGEIRSYAFAVGLAKNLAIPRDDNDRLLSPGPIIKDAHRHGLMVLGWTFRRENRYLPAEFRIGTDPYRPGDLEGEIARFRSAGMDGFFLDQPDIRRHPVATTSKPGRRLGRGLGHATTMLLSRSA